MNSKANITKVFAVLGLGTILIGAPTAYAVSTADSQLTQTIEAGAIYTNFTDASGNEVSNPSFAMSNATVSTTGNMTTTGTYGSDSQRATVDKPGLAGGFTLTLAAADAAIGWYSTGSPLVSAYKHNGATASEGQLTVNAGGTLGQYNGSTNTGITGVVPGTFTGTTPITLMAGSTEMDEVWRGYVHSVGLTQVIPSGLPADTYAIDLVQTATSA